jgi:hypothetical protein
VLLVHQLELQLEVRQVLQQGEQQQVQRPPLQLQVLCKVLAWEV